MKDTLVTITDGKLSTTSRKVAEVFGKNHQHVLRDIRKLQESEITKEFTLSNFGYREFTTAKGNIYNEYTMTKDGFMLLVMAYTTSSALQIKLKYIEAFNAMESRLLKDAEKIEWKQARLQGTQVRKSVTDTIKSFVEYATAQGSQSASKYYANLTKMEYAALGLIDYSSKVPDGFRDTLDLMELSYLTAAEYIARQAFEVGMENKMHYKDIYQYAKLSVTNYANGLILPKLGSK